MTTFTVDDRDLDDLVRRDVWQSLRYQGIWPVCAFAAAFALSWVHSLLAATALGMGLAWTYSLIQVLRGIRPWYSSHHG